MGLCAGKPLLRRRWERVVRPMPVLAPGALITPAICPDADKTNFTGPE